MRILGPRLLHAREQIGVGGLRLRERLPDRHSGARTRLAQPAISGRRLLEPAREVGDPQPQVLLARGERIASPRLPGHPTAGEQIEHLPGAQPLARREGRRESSARALDQRELGIHIPLVGEIRGATLLEGQVGRDAFDVRGGRPQFRGRLRQSATAPQRLPQSGVQRPRHARRERRPKALEPPAIQRFRGEAESFPPGDIPERAEGRRFPHHVAHHAHSVEREREDPTGARCVPALVQGVPDQQARDRSAPRNGGPLRG